LRAAHFVEDRELYQIDVLEEIVQESGLDINAFRSYMDDGSAQKAFIGDLYLAGEAEVSSFPTFSIKYNQKTFILRGFVEFDVFMEAILEIMGRVIMPRFPKVTDQDFLDMLAKHPRMSREEIESAFNFSKDEPMEKFLNRLLEEGRIQKTNFETNFFVSCI
ncbi:MAG: DsbA family protein, partial [Veillonella sp.]|nr:DsbA family protein [Veillonella sp.]